LRNSNLDIIRGALASWIVILHVFWFAGLDNGFFAWSGRTTVEGFIVLSGYVITRLLIFKGESYGLFIFRRFMRLFPAFAVCMILALILRPWTLGTAPSEFAREAAENQFFWQQLVAHASLLYGLVPESILPQGSIAFLPPAWSISLEMQLYLVAPLVLWLVRRVRYGLYVTGILSMMPIFVPQVAWRLHEYMSPMGAFLPQKFAFFFLGMLMACVMSDWKTLAPKPTKLWPLVHLGQISYSLYLIHFPILHLVRSQLLFDLSPSGKALILAGIGIPTSLVTASVLYHFVEKPGIAFGTKCAAWCRRRSTDEKAGLHLIETKALQ
jgi:peptidoglycan/LPS O-acetylase OafA/YrhL